MAAAANTDKFRLTAPNFATTLASAMLNSDTTMTPQSVVGLPTGTAVCLTIDATSSTGAITPAVTETVIGVVSAPNIISLLRGQDGTTAQAHASGANIAMLWTANDVNDIVNALLTQHSQTGAILPASVTNAMLAGNIGYANLLSTIFSGQLASFTNSGSAGGTGYYINLGGIKLCWGTSALMASSFPGTVYTLVFPGGFFTSVQSLNLTAVGVATQSNQFIDHTGSLNVGLNNLYFCSPGGAASTQASWFAIGT